MKNKTLFSIVIAAALFLFFSGPGLGQAATLTVGSNSAPPGTQNVIIPVSLTSGGGENVAGLNLDISYNTSCLTFKGVTAGQASSDAGKSVSSSTPQPETLRIIVFGLNQTSIANGEVANVSFDIQAAATAGVVTLSVSNAIASAPDAKSVPLTTVAGSITVTGGVNNPPVLEPIGNKSIQEGQYLGFNVSATDPDNDNLTYSASNLPQGASFTASTKTFSWTPGYNQAGTYLSVHFSVTDTKAGTDSEDITITVTDVNRAPVLSAIGNKSVNEGETLTLTISATDPDADAVTITAAGLASFMSFDGAAFTVTPGLEDSGNYQVTFTASDSKLTDSETITVTVGDVNRPPVLSAIGNKSVNEGQTLTIILSATDPDNDNLTYSATGLPTGATFTASTKTFSWTPGYNQAGTYLSVHFSVADTKGGTDSEDITITVTDVNRAPVLSAIGNKSVNEGETLTLTISATDPDADAVTITAAGLASFMSFDGAAFTVTPGLEDSGNYQVTFTASDSKLTDSETITVTVGDVNRPPVLSAIGNKSVNEGQTLTIILSATDPDNDNLTYSATGLPTGATFTASTKTFSWTPGYNQAGTYPAVHFSVADTKGGTDSEDITITVTDVNRSPQISSGPLSTPATINENQTAQISVTAVDPDGDNLTYQWQAAGGTITGSGATVTYNPPDVSAQTAYTVNLTIDDSRGGTAAASVSVTVMPVIPNSAALSLGKSSGQQGAQNIIIPLNLTSLPANIVTGLNLDITYDNTALTFSQVTAGKASSDAQKSVSSSAPQPGTIRIIVFGLNQNTMANGEAAQVSFNITADAKAGETTLSLSNATATDAQAKPITLTLVNGVITITEKPNNPPVLSAIGNKSVNEGETLTLTISATDPDNDNLTYSATGLPTGATFTASTKTFSWTPGYNQAGTYPAVHFSVADTKGGTDSEDITITVTDVNRSPQISSGPLSTPATINENQTSQLSVTAVDPDGDNLTYQWQAAGGTITGSGATVTYNPPDVSAQTAYTVNLTIDDSRGGTAAASVSVTVMPVIPNSAALSLGKSSGQQGAQNIIIPLNLTSLPANIVTGLNLDITYDNTALTFSQVTAGKASSDAQKSVSSSAPQPGTIRIIVFGLNQNTIANGEAAQVSFNITADAKAGETTLSLSNATATDAQAKPITLTLVNGAITITEKPNNPPVLSAIGNKSVNEGETLTLTISATDPDNDNLTYSATGLPTGATFTASTKTFSWTPGYNQAGTYPAVHFSVADTKGGTDSEDITITVTDVNRSPQISSGPLSTPATINENQTAQISVTAVDPDGDNLTYQWQAAGGTITGSGATVTYNPPDVSAQTAYTVNLTIDDSRGGTATASVSVTVMPVAAGTAHLTLGSAQGYPGDNIPIPLNISSTPSGKVVSGLKVDLFYDAAALNVASVTIGQAATDAQKSLTYIQIAAGRLRIIVFGLNQDTIADGEVANINFKILSSSSLGEKTLRLDSCFVTDPDALNAPLTTDAGAIKVLDHTPPTGTILINNGAEYTNNPAITLTLSASDESSVAEMRFSNDGITYSQPEAYASTKSWNLIPGEGTKTIYVIFKDSVNNWNQSPFTDTVILDTTPPVMRITNPTQASLLTNNPVLNISGEVEEDTAGIVAVRINGNNLPLLRKGKMSIFSYAARLTEGLNTLTVECIDGAGNQAQTEILATLDSQAPSGAISINNGARYTNSPEVILSLQAEELTSSSGIERMQFSNDGTKFSDLEDYSSTKNWSLSSREGEKTAYVRFQDKAGNLSSAFKAGIILDQTVPRGSFSINNGAEYTNSQTVALTFSASDDLSGVSQMRIRAGDKDSGEIPYSQAYGLTLSPGDGTKTISAQFKDGAGNWSGDEAISSSIILDTAAPAQPVLSRITPTLVNGYTKTREINIHADKEQDTAIFINSREKAALNKSSSFNSRVTLEEGQNSIRITAKDAAGNESAPLDLEVKLKTKVGFTIILPNKQYLNSADLISGSSDIVALYTIDDESEIRTKKIKLRAGSNDIDLSAEDFLGNRGQYKLELTLDTTPPKISISSYQDGQSLSSQPISLKGKVKDADSGVKSVKVNGQPAALSKDEFSANLNLNEGANTIFVEAEDNAGNSAASSLVLNYTAPASLPPAAVETPAASTTPAEEESPTVIYTGGPIIIENYESIKKKEEEAQKQTKKEPEKRFIAPSIVRETQQQVYDEPYRESYRESSQPEVQTLPTAPAVEGQKITKVEAPLSDKEALKEKETEKPKETIKTPVVIPVVKVKQMKGFLIWRLYKLELEGAIQPLSWRLAGKQKLPFGLGLDKKKGIVSGIAWVKGKFDLKLEITTHNRKKLELPCKLEIE